MYLWIKWLHVIAIISWMAGLLYLFRIFVYHVEKGQTSKDNHELLSLMANKLYRFITVPAAHISWVCGLGMIALNPTLMRGGWMHTKLLAVVALTAVTWYGGKLKMRLQTKTAPIPSGKSLRFLNEVPTLLMMIAVAMVVVRPF